MRVFISHASCDGASKANELAIRLEREGLRCWLAPRDVRPGIPYPRQIIEAIEGGLGLVLLLTSGANESQDVLQEVQAAHSAKKVIAPVRIGAAQPGPDLRYYLGVRHNLKWNDAGSVARDLIPILRSNEAVVSEPRRVVPQELLRKLSKEERQQLVRLYANPEEVRRREEERQRVREAKAHERKEIEELLDRARRLRDKTKPPR